MAVVAPKKIAADESKAKAKPEMLQKPAEPPKPPGRPSIYTAELAAQVCMHIADGKSLRVIGSMDDMPHQATIMAWLDGSRPEFSEQYARAREAQADKLAEEALAIADDGRSDTYIDGDGNVKTDPEVIQRSKLRVDTRKWLASKMAPKKYGDKLAVGGADDLGPVQTVTKVMTDAERAVRLARAINDNPAAMHALVAALSKKGGAK
ncbi:MAG: hypothetical protein QE485_10645 [Acidovorax sp.]|uniref:terminase small subunit-like protein n=1 Tax=Acidovorax sp. TaxID=1872122 RepID=UPI002602BDDF|nr:hypothetical protein [Acidovorax sp.]MDH4417673.1 hypothetical protein [Acidovorax sp.]